MRIGDFEIDEDAKRIVLNTIVVPFVAPSLGGGDTVLEIEGETTEFPDEWVDPIHWGCALLIPATRLYMHFEIALETGLAEASVSYSTSPPADVKHPDVWIRGGELAAIDTRKLFNLLGPRGDGGRIVRAAQIIEESGWEKLEVKGATPGEIEELYERLKTSEVKLL